MLERSVKDWREAFAKFSIRELAIKHDVDEDLIIRVKNMVEKTRLSDDVTIYVGEPDSDW